MSASRVQRTFKITDSEIGYSGGTYKTNKTGTPLSAAHRGASMLFRMARNDKNKPEWRKYKSDKKLIKFTIRETTRGSDKAEYQYEAKIHKLRASDVKIVKRGDVEYKVEYEIITRAGHYRPTPFGGAVCIPNISSAELSDEKKKELKQICSLKNKDNCSETNQCILLY